MTVTVRLDAAPALGDVRTLGAGDTIVVVSGATERRDWARYADALAVAVSRGAEVRQCTSS